MVVIKGVKTGGTFYIKDTREWLSDPVNKHEVQKFLFYKVKHGTNQRRT